MFQQLVSLNRISGSVSGGDQRPLHARMYVCVSNTTLDRPPRRTINALVVIDGPSPGWSATRKLMIHHPRIQQLALKSQPSLRRCPCALGAH